ncbi:MAG: alanine racemase [Aggregatilineales bacterium]
MISLYDILEASNGQLFGEPGAQIFTDFCVDATQAKSGSLFLAFRTDRGDSHLYIGEAIANGASGVICTSPPEQDTSGASVVLVRDTLNAVLAWARYVLGKTGTKVIGVTGSIGKSVAVDAISRVLGTRYSVHADMIEENGRLGLVLALAGIKPTHDFVVVKLATTHPGEMATMVSIAQPTVGVLTHLGDMSTNTFDTTDLIMKEQETLIDQLTEDGLAILNFDVERVRALANRTKAKVRSVGIGAGAFDADVYAFNTVIGLENTGFDLRCDGERHIAQRIPVLGKQHIYSVLSALAVGMHYGISAKEGLKTLSTLMPLPGRMNPLIGKADSLIIDDTYNANTESTLSSIEWLKSVKAPQGRVVMVLGELSGSQARNHIGYRAVGQEAADVADIIITQGTEASQIARAALDMGMDPYNIRTTYSTHDSVSLLLNHYKLTQEDIVLVKGNATARMEQVVRALLRDDTDAQHLVRYENESAGAIAFEPVRPSWVEIDNDALAGNVAELKALVGKKVELMAVVKSDAYGHGAIATSQTALLNGATYLGVSSMAEALQLREASIHAPILVMNYTPAYLVRQALFENVTLTVFDLDIAKVYDRVAREVSGKLKVHVKIDTGMGRFGAMAGTAVGLFRHLIAMPNLNIEGVYTHFSTADEDLAYTKQQIDTFRSVVRPLQATTGLKFKYTHTANSAATIATKDSHFDMVRTGLAMYGLHPSDTVQLPEGFKPVMTWKTTIAQVKTLPSDHPVGYGNTYITTDEEQIAVLPVGFSDGFRRGPGNWGEVLVHGVRAPIRGRVSMEKTVISVDHIPGVSTGDEVVLLGRQGDEIITAEEVADRLGTTNYEVVTNILPRVPRE